MTPIPILQIDTIGSIAVELDAQSVRIPIVLANGRRYELDIRPDLLHTVIRMFVGASAQPSLAVPANVD